MVSDLDPSVRPRALITGVAGQDGYYLARLLVKLGYDVFGTIHRSSPTDPALQQRLPGVRLLQADVTDAPSTLRALLHAKPAEVYHLAATSFIPSSYAQPAAVAATIVLGTVNVLECVRLAEEMTGAPIRLCNASTGAIFAASHQRCTEASPLSPDSPYGVAKLHAQEMVRLYREQHGMHCSSAVLFNHESPMRPRYYLSRKVTAGVAAIVRGGSERIVLHNTEAQRDWGFAGDYVDAMHRMLQLQEPRDLVIASGESHSVAQLVSLAFRQVGIDKWQAHVDMRGRNRPKGSDRDVRMADPSKAAEVLGWVATTSLPVLLRQMVEADLRGEFTRGLRS